MLDKKGREESFRWVCRSLSLSLSLSLCLSGVRARVRVRVNIGSGSIELDNEELEQSLRFLFLYPSVSAALSFRVYTAGARYSDVDNIGCHNSACSCGEPKLSVLLCLLHLSDVPQYSFFHSLRSPTSL